MTHDRTMAEWRGVTCGRDAGLVTLELALLMPTLLFLFAGALSVGHRIYVHHEVTHQARHAARACVVAGLTDANDVHACEDLSRAALADAQGTSWAESCGGPRATVTVDPPSPVGTLRVRISCIYLGIVPSGLLSPSEDVEIEQEYDIEAQASLDFTVDTSPRLLRRPEPVQGQAFPGSFGAVPPSPAQSSNMGGTGSDSGPSPAERYWPTVSPEDSLFLAPMVGNIEWDSAPSPSSEERRWPELSPEDSFFLAPTVGGVPFGS